MNNELDRIIAELGILRINIASMSARIEALQQSLERMKCQQPDPMTVPDEIAAPLPDDEPLTGTVITEDCGQAADVAAIAESAELEENEDASGTPDIEPVRDEISEVEDPDSDGVAVQETIDGPEYGIEPETEPEQEEEPEPEPESEQEQDQEQESEPVQTRELRQFFTINDRYRFRRELFGNSDTEMADTLNLIEAMGNLAEAQDYVYTDLEWDAENEEVQEFMTIVGRYFNER